MKTRDLSKTWELSPFRKWSFTLALERVEGNYTYVCLYVYRADGDEGDDWQHFHALTYTTDETMLNLNSRRIAGNLYWD